jgi:monoamine oxidase
MSADVDVVIIGAGAAGIAAARRLAASHLSATVLEATARVGGRAWTFEVAGMRLDLGCGWLHSADRNPWTRIAEGAGFVVDRRAPAWGRQVDDIGFSRRCQTKSPQCVSPW